MNKQEMNAIEFRDELITLLNKYKYALSGDNKDDGYMLIDDNVGNQFLLSGDFENYILLDIDGNNIIHKLIYNSFNEDVTSFLKNKIVGVFTNDKQKMQSLLSKIILDDASLIKSYSLDSGYIHYLNGDEVLWLKPSNLLRGLRVNNVYIDGSLCIGDFYDFILPICNCKKENVNII